MAILKRRNNKGEVEKFEIPDAVLQTYKVIPNVNAPDDERAVELYRMEYERCAQRYNDLYNAAWTNFSYMALVAGGLLTFGGARFVTPLTGLLACLPLLFWWIATFEPLNRYGDKVQGDLVRIETALNALGIFQNLPTPANQGLAHFQNFAAREHERSAKKIIIKHVIALVLFLPSLLFAMDAFLGKDKPPALTVVALVSLVFVFSFVIQLIGITKEREDSFLSKPQTELKSALRETRRVRNRVRIAALVLLITAICFGLRVWQLQRDRRSLTVPPSKATEALSNG